MFKAFLGRKMGMKNVTFVGTKTTVFVEGKGVVERVPSESHFGKGDGKKEGAMKKPEYSWILTRSGTFRMLLEGPVPVSDKEAKEKREKGHVACFDSVFGFLQYGKSKNALTDTRLLQRKMEPDEADAHSQKLFELARWNGEHQENDWEDIIEIKRIAVALLPKGFGEEKAMLCEEIAEDCKCVGNRVWAAEAYRDAAIFTPASNRKGRADRYVKMGMEYASANQAHVAKLELERAGEAGSRALGILARKDPAFKQQP